MDMIEENRKPYFPSQMSSRTCR